MIHCIVSYIQIDTNGFCGHVPLVVILYVLSEVYNLLVHDFQGLKPACSLMRCPSTIGANYVSIFHRAYTCIIHSCILLQRKCIPGSFPWLHLYVAQSD